MQPTRWLGLGSADRSEHDTYREIARTRGLRGFHNQALVVLSLG